MLCVIFAIASCKAIRQPVSRIFRYAAIELYLIFVCCSAGSELYSLWREYEESSTPEARLLKQFDKLEMLIQADEYERGAYSLLCQDCFMRLPLRAAAQGIDLQEFFTSTPLGLFTDPTVREVAEELVRRRADRRTAPAPQ